MTAKKSSRSNGSRNGNGNGSGYLALEHRLVLASWVQRQFGYAENRDLLQDLAQADEGFDGDGRSFVLGRLVSRGEKCLVPREDLELYDANVRHHLAHINRRRTQPVTLRYFQHFALLATELYLDRLFREPANLLADLNRFVRDENIGRPVLPHPEFAEGDLRKLAFWMATGSGKTLLFHIYYW